jgi:hypothetical protein
VHDAAGAALCLIVEVGGAVAVAVVGVGRGGEGIARVLRSCRFARGVFVVRAVNADFFIRCFGMAMQRRRDA